MVIFSSGSEALATHPLKIGLGLLTHQSMVYTAATIVGYARAEYKPAVPGKLPIYSNANLLIPHPLVYNTFFK